VPNILDAPTYTYAARKALLSRIQTALCADPDCRYDFKGPFRAPTADEFGNWQARQDVLQAKLTFPVDQTLETLSAENQPSGPDGNLAHTPDQIAEA
jgi:hypothetical protein